MTESADNYDVSRYERPSVTVDLVIFTLIERALHVLLVQRRNWPYQGCWAIPGGFVEMTESLDDAAKRELEEETGLRDVYLEQLYTFGTPGRDPRTRVISVAYLALIQADTQTLQPSDETEDVRWFPYAALPTQLAFDHQEILTTALHRLRAKLEYTTLAFQLLPEVFSMLELKAIYEQILGEGELDKGNFYRKIKEARVLEETGERREGRGRPTRLYRFAAKRGDEQFVFRWREARREGISH